MAAQGRISVQLKVLDLGGVLNYEVRRKSNSSDWPELICVSPRWSAQGRLELQPLIINTAVSAKPPSSHVLLDQPASCDGDLATDNRLLIATHRLMRRNDPPPAQEIRMPSTRARGAFSSPRGFRYRITFEKEATAVDQTSGLVQGPVMQQPPGAVPKEQAEIGVGLKHLRPEQNCSCNFGCFAVSAKQPQPAPGRQRQHTPVSTAKLEAAIKAAAIDAQRDVQRELQKTEERSHVIKAFDKLKASSGDKLKARARGDCCDGEGSYKYASGAEYEGQWKDGKQHGQGTYCFADKSTFVGQWVEGNMHGHGLYTYAHLHKEIFKSGDWYEGQFQCNNRHGQGTFNRPNDRSYVGQWKDDKKHGLGTCTIEGGDIYHGQYRNGEMEGRGILKYANGDVYEGECCKNQRDGQGKYTYADGTVFEGQFKRNRKHGFGVMTVQHQDGTMTQNEHEYWFGERVGRPVNVSQAGKPTLVQAQPAEKFEASSSPSAHVTDTPKLQGLSNSIENLHAFVQQDEDSTDNVVLRQPPNEAIAEEEEDEEDDAIVASALPKAHQLTVTESVTMKTAAKRIPKTHIKWHKTRKDRLAAELLRPAEVGGSASTPMTLPPPLTPLHSEGEPQAAVQPSPTPQQLQSGHLEAPAAHTAPNFQVGSLVQMVDGTIGEIVGGPDENGHFDVDVYSSD